MASTKLSFGYFFLLIFLCCTVHCDDESDNVLQGINSHRTSLNAPALTKNDKAGCLADEVADQLEDQPCPTKSGSSTLRGPNPKLSDYPKMLSKCGININHTTDDVILPVCVPHLVETLVLANYTRTSYSKYVNDTKYTGAGLGHEDDWMVLILTTNTPAGDFAGANRLMSIVGFSHCLMYFMLALFLYFV